MNTKLFGVASVLLFVLFIPVTTFAVSPQVTGNGVTIAELMQQITALQVQVEELKADLANTKQELAVVKEEIRITKTLQRGMADEEVRKLQEFLSTMPDIYPEGLVTGYFGSLTERAVKKWQEGNGIESIGIVGPKTRAKLSEVTGSISSGGSSSAIPAVPTSASGVATVPATPAQPEADHPTVTPSGTVPATPAQPIGQTGVTTVPATPATPGGQGADTTPPSISSIQATNITQTTAVISWTTNEVSSSDVYYARNSSVLTNGTLRGSVAGNVTNHSITLSGLVTYSGYYYLVVSRDEAGNTATSSVNMFVSLMEPTVTPTTRIITATAGTGGTISPDGSVVVTQGMNQTFTITPNAGYAVSSVVVDGVSQGAISTYTFTNVQAAHTITATFSQITHVVAVTQGSNGTISPGTTSVVSGGSQAFTITPATGYQITSVTVDGANQGAISSYSFMNVQTPHTITAAFSLIAINQSCTLTVSLSASTQAAQYVSPGQNAVPLVKFNATPNCDGTLVSFAVSLLPMPNGYQNISALRLYNDTTGVQLGTTQSVSTAGMNFLSVNTPLTANQTLVLRVVGDVSSSAINGSTVYGVFGGSYGVTGSGGVIGNNASGNLISGNTMTVATTPAAQYNITVTQGANGTVSPGTTSVASGGSQTFTITPATGYQISSVTVDGVSQGAISTYAFTNVTAAHTITLTTTPLAIPQPVSGFTMSAGAPGFLSFSWTPRNDVAGYRIYRTNTATNVTTTSYFSPANMSGGGNQGYDQGVQYSAYIVSVDAAGNTSIPSNTLYATTTKLTKPTNFTVSATSPTAVSLAWTASEGIVYKYQITRWTGSVSMSSPKSITEVLAPTTSYIDTTVAPGVTYIYWVKSVSVENYQSIDTGAPAITTPTT